MKRTEYMSMDELRDKAAVWQVKVEFNDGHETANFPRVCREVDQIGWMDEQFRTRADVEFIMCKREDGNVELSRRRNGLMRGVSKPVVEAPKQERQLIVKRYDCDLGHMAEADQGLYVIHEDHAESHRYDDEAELALCRKTWEQLKPDVPFPDFWAGWSMALQVKSAIYFEEVPQ